MNLTALMNFESNFIRPLRDLELNRFVTNSIRELVEDFFLHVAISLVITVSCTYRNADRYYNSITQDLYNIRNMHVQLVYVNASRPQRVEGPRLHNLIMVDSLDGFLAADIANYTAQYDSNEYYYIFLQQYDALIPKDMQAIFEYCWRNQLINCNIQTQSAQKQIRMYTYYPYTAKHCGIVVPVEINEFTNTTGWRHKDFFPDKLRNFYNCPLRLAVRELPPFLKLRNDSRGQLNVGGFEGHLMDEIAGYLNFTIAYVPIQVDDRTFNFCCGIIAYLKNHKVDIGIGYYRIRKELELVSTFAFPHYMSSAVHVIFLNAHNLTAYEIMVYPFSRRSWISAIVAFGCVFLAADLLRCKSPFRSDFRKFFSFNNFVATMLGIAVISDPRSLPDRLLFSTTLWAAFLLRSMYAAFLYSLFRDNIHQLLPKAASDLLQQQYVAVMNNFMHNELQRIGNEGGYADMRQIIYNSSDEFIAYAHLEQHNTERLVAPSTREYVHYYGTAKHRAGMFHIMRENIINQHIIMHMIKHSFLIDQLNEAIMRVDEVGLLRLWIYRELDDRYFRSTHLYGQKMISQSDLWAIYVVGGALQLLALCIFALELCAQRYARLQQLFE